MINVLLPLEVGDQRNGHRLCVLTGPTSRRRNWQNTIAKLALVFANANLSGFCDPGRVLSSVAG